MSGASPVTPSNLTAASDRGAAWAPFRQGRFEDLPDLPRIPHPYFSASAEDVELDSSAFGRMRVHLVIHGEGPPLLLVHGLMTSSYSWRYALERLAERFRLFIPELPGCGKSDPVPDRPHSPAALASFLGELQDLLGITGCAAVGNSLGGYLCLHRALDAPESFSRLAVIHAPGVPQLRLRALHLALRLPGLARGLGWWVRRDPLRWAHRHVHYYDETLKSREEARVYGAPLSTKAGTRSFARYLGDALDPRAMSRFAAELARRRDQGQSFPMPLMLAYAREDPIVAPEIGPKLHALVPDARFEWIQECSHFMHVDNPREVLPLLTDFLAAEQPAGRPRLQG